MAPVQRTGTVQDSLASYLQSISCYPLLGADQEILLAKQVRDLAELRRLKPISSRRPCDGAWWRGNGPAPGW